MAIIASMTAIFIPEFGTFEQRKLGRLFDKCADIVARRLSELLATEFSRVPKNKRVAAVMVVSDTFTAARFSDEALFCADLDARMVERQLQPTASRVLPRANAPVMRRIQFVVCRPRET